MVKNLPAMQKMQETRVQSLGGDNALVSAEGAMELCHSDFFGKNMLWGVQLTESLKLPLQRRWKALLTRVAARQ